MKKQKLFSLIIIAFVSTMILPTFASAATLTEDQEVSFIETLFTPNASDHTGSLVNPDQKEVISQPITEDEKELLAKIVHAEAKGEPYEGKVAVATVILNRVDHSDFPDSVKQVIYQRLGQSYAFSPVQNGMINNKPSKEAKKAVIEAIDHRSEADDAIYFYNPDTAQDTWIFSRTVIKTIGNHSFAI